MLSDAPLHRTASGQVMRIVVTKDLALFKIKKETKERNRQMAKRKTKAEKAAETAAHDAFKRNCRGATFNVMNLGPMMRSVELAAMEGRDVDAAMIAAIAEHREN